MTSDYITELGTSFDEVFFLIGAAVLLIEIVKGLFTKSLTGRGALDIIASISTQIPSLLVEVFLMSFAYLGFVAFHGVYVSWALPRNIWVLVVAVIAADFIYYWEHRLAHRIRLLWTQHAVHHSSRHMNAAIAIRFGPFEGVISALLHFPLILIGFPPDMVFFGIIVVLAYQTWIHTELIGKLGPLDWLLNTPANHRVHHGCNEKYIDKNYGGILMIWDHMFRSYQAEEETPRYGLVRDYESVNPVSVWFSELPGFFGDIAKARSGRELWMCIFGPPEWDLEQDRQTRS